MEREALNPQENYWQRVAQVLAAEPDGTRLALGLAEIVAPILAAHQVLVGLMVNDEIVVEQYVCDDVVQELHRRFSSEGEAIGWVMRYKRPYLSPVADRDPNISAPFAQEFGCFTLLTVPILNHQRHLVGVIEVHNRTDGQPFTEADVELLQMIALQAAPAVERAQMFNKMGAWANAVANLMAFNASLNRNLDPPLLLRRLVEHAAGFLGASAGLAGLVDNNTIQADGYWHRKRWQPLRCQWRAQEGLPGWVFFNECTYLTNQYQQDRLADPRFIQEYGISAALCVPIMDAREQVLGFFELHNKNDGRELFTWSDAQFMESLANTAAVAIRNAWLLKEVEAQREQLRALARA